mmetsp:Transcript_13041/g.20912  ORF Transcript_13041/g.20912 Transcript_13041/m.20912 type:complete len:238 (+) Transcript_13041:1356-2069(+)
MLNVAMRRVEALWFKLSDFLSHGTNSRSRSAARVGTTRELLLVMPSDCTAFWRIPKYSSRNFFPSLPGFSASLRYAFVAASQSPPAAASKPADLSCSDLSSSSLLDNVLLKGNSQPSGVVSAQCVSFHMNCTVWSYQSTSNELQSFERLLTFWIRPSCLNVALGPSPSRHSDTNSKTNLTQGAPSLLKLPKRALREGSEVRAFCSFWFSPRDASSSFVDSLSIGPIVIEKGLMRDVS